MSIARIKQQVRELMEMAETEGMSLVLGTALPEIREELQKRGVTENEAIREIKEYAAGGRAMVGTPSTE